MNNTIKELKEKQDERSAMIDALQCLFDRQKWYMSAVTDEDGNQLKDEDGDVRYTVPDVGSSDWAYFNGYQKVIDMVYKALK